MWEGKSELSSIMRFQLPMVISLSIELSKRDIANRYKGSILGGLWAFLNPLFLLSIYTIVFGSIIKVRWPNGSGSQTEFALILFIGLILYNIFGECITRAPSLITSNANLVKKVAFPLHALLFSHLMATLFHGITSIIVWLVGYLLFFGVPEPTTLLVAFYLIPFVALTFGLILFLSALGVFFRDINQVIMLTTTGLLFLSPIFFPLETISEPLRKWLYLNPLTVPVTQMRELMFFGNIPPIAGLVSYSFAALVILCVGLWVFKSLRPRFADVI